MAALFPVSALPYDMKHNLAAEHMSLRALGRYAQTDRESLHVFTKVIQGAGFLNPAEMRNTLPVFKNMLPFLRYHQKVFKGIGYWKDVLVKDIKQVMQWLKGVAKDPTHTSYETLKFLHITSMGELSVEGRIPHWFKDDPLIVRLAFLLSGQEVLRYAAERFQGDDTISAQASPIEEAMLRLIRKEILFRKIAENYPDHPDIAKIGVALRPVNLLALSNALQDDLEIVKIALAQDWTLLRYAGKVLRDNVEFMKELLAQHPDALRYATDRIKHNLEVIKIAVAKDWTLLRYAGKVLRDNVEFMKELLAQHPDALQYASDGIKNNPEVVKIAVVQSWAVLRHAGEVVRDNVEFMKELLAQHPSAVQYASNRIKNNPEVVKIAVAKDSTLLRYPGEVLRDNGELMKELLA